MFVSLNTNKLNIKRLRRQRAKKSILFFVFNKKNEAKMKKAVEILKNTKFCSDKIKIAKEKIVKEEKRITDLEKLKLI